MTTLLSFMTAIGKTNNGGLSADPNNGPSTRHPETGNRIPALLPSRNRNGWKLFDGPVCYRAPGLCSWTERKYKGKYCGRRQYRGSTIKIFSPAETMKRAGAGVPVLGCLSRSNEAEREVNLGCTQVDNPFPPSDTIVVGSVLSHPFLTLPFLVCEVNLF